MDSQKIYDTLSHIIKGMFPHYPLPNFSVVNIPVTFSQEAGVLLLITVIGIFIVSNERVRTPLFVFCLKKVERVQAIFKDFIYSIGDAQLILSYESGHLYFYWILCWLTCRVFRMIVIPTILSNLASPNLFLKIVIVFGVTLCSIALTLVPTLVLGLSTRLYKRVSDIHRQLLLESKKFQMFFTVLLCFSAWLRFSEVRVRIIWLLAFLFFACVVMFSSLFLLAIWLCAIYTFTYYIRVVSLVVLLRPREHFTYADLGENLRCQIRIYLGSPLINNLLFFRKNKINVLKTKTNNNI
jgi:hypothetical protein